MKHDLERAATWLPRGQLLRIDDGQGTLVQVLAGTLWVTQEGDLRDIVLEAGDEALIERGGLSILSALDDSGFVLSKEPVPPRSRPSARTAQAALAVH